MEQFNDTAEMLDLMIRPAFRVKNGVITYVNHAAQGYMLSEGDAIGPLLHTGQEEYAQFTHGQPDSWEARDECISNKPAL